MTTGTLFVVATPIGNLEDITLRGLRILNEVGLIAAEDTRHTRNLLTRYAIKTPLISCHEHNIEKVTPKLISRLDKGISIALTSDAGTPLVSDPGYYLVRSAIDAGITVVPVPGACAAIAALSVSGLPLDSFLFLGFLPRKKARKSELLRSLKEDPRTFILYESPVRFISSLKEIVEVIGDRKAIVARELTKCHEEILRGKISELLAILKDRGVVKGECTLVVEGNIGEGKQSEALTQDFVEQLCRLRNEGDCSLKEAVEIVSNTYDISKRQIYEKALKLWDKKP
ncbi:MAG: 16S rRNA (cytidine(1402)-2'-O)-methyltransferase [Pseudomonadota bacterium]